MVRVRHFYPARARASSIWIASSLQLTSNKEEQVTGSWKESEIESIAANEVVFCPSFRLKIPIKTCNTSIGVRCRCHCLASNKFRQLIPSHSHPWVGETGYSWSYQHEWMIRVEFDKFSQDRSNKSEVVVHIDCNRIRNLWILRDSTHDFYVDSRGFW